MSEQIRVDFKHFRIFRLSMVMSASPTDEHRPSTGRYLNQSKTQAALDHAQELGASYAEARLMAITDSSVALRDAKLERAIPDKKLVLLYGF